MSTAEPHPPESSHEVSGLVEHLFRHEWGRMVATLTRIFGIEHLTLAEDVVQEALARALQTWPYHGIPRNPPAWLMRTSRNLAVDVVRREKVFRNKEAEIVRLMEREIPGPDQASIGDTEIADDRLRLMFVCCHPGIPAEAQIALALKTLCGFSVTEISHAFLTTEAVIAKRLTRAKQSIREMRVAFEIPAGVELERRLQNVLQSLYLMFNEGYKASTGDSLVRRDICDEAIRLTSLLAKHAAGDRPETHALLAMMLLNAARIPARVDDQGNLLLLKAQDRRLWDQPMIARGMFHLARSASGSQMSQYHLQAGIAACHSSAKDYASTDWLRILSLYDRLAEIDDSPIVALNRAVAVSQVLGPTAGMEAVAAIRDRRPLESYYLFHAVLGEFRSQLNQPDRAAGHFRRSLELTRLKPEKAFLTTKLRDCEEQLRSIPAQSSARA